MNEEWVFALVGGALIGVSVSLMLLWNGRVTGISGIFNGALASVKGDSAWRWSFLGGLFVGGLILRALLPSAFSGQLQNDHGTIVVAGLLVGVGTILGSGCTSGHGVCGISRLSPRSLLSTIVFISAGALTVVVLRQWGVVP